MNLHSFKTLFLGTLIKETTHDWEKMACPRNFSIVNFPVLYDTFDKAEEACNKITIGSMTGLFQVYFIFSCNASKPINILWIITGSQPY